MNPKFNHIFIGNGCTTFMNAYACVPKRIMEFF